MTIFDGFVSENRVACGAQMRACDWDSVRWPAVVELAAVDQLLMAVEQEQVWRAGSSIGFCDRLRFVEQVWE